MNGKWCTCWERWHFSSPTNRSGAIQPRREEPMDTEKTAVGAGESSPAPAGCAVTISDDDILSLWRTARPSARQDGAMVYQTGPYDVDHPTFELRRLVELAIEYGHNVKCQAER